MYVLGEAPRGQSDAFEALERVFGGDEFSAREAEEVLEEVLELSPNEARNEFRALLRSRAIEEAS